MEQVAQRAGIPTVTVQRLLTAKRGITITTFERLCGALGVSPAHVMVLAMSRIGTADPDLVARVLSGINASATPTIGDAVTSNT